MKIRSGVLRRLPWHWFFRSFGRKTEAWKTFSLLRQAGYTLIAKYAKMIVKRKKWKVYRLTGYFASLFSHFAPFFSLFACQSRHSHKKSKDFVVYFFDALIKHKIRVKYEKCIVSVSYLVVWFAKTFAKYPQNVKYKKCIASLRVFPKFVHNF